MDLSRINKSNHNLENNNVSFSGRKTVKDDMGNRLMRVYPPASIQINPETEELGIEYVTMTNAQSKNKKRTDFNWKITSPAPIRIQTDDDFKSGNKTYFDIDLKKQRLKNAGEFGYRFVVYKKDNGDLKDKQVLRAYTDSAGSKVALDKDNVFTVASTRQGTPQIKGPMAHIFTDSLGVIDKLKKQDGTKMMPEDYDEMSAQLRRNHFNRLGGTIKDITERLDTDFEPYELIMSTPLIGGGKVASHMYHPANHFKTSEGTGTKDDFLDLQVACFNHGKGYVLDGAFTSQGLEGVQLNQALMFKDSKFKYWFKNPSEDGFQLGVLPDFDTKYTGIRIVNPKDVEGYEYNPEQPTYLQFYDTRLASKEQLEDYSALIEQYDNKMPVDPYEITTHNDSVLPNKFEIDPSSKVFRGKTYAPLDKWEEEGDLKDVLAPSNLAYSLVKKGEVGGFTGWDGNVDLIKMNLANHVNDVNYKEGANQARNHLYNVARYWTEETRNALIFNVANEIYNKRNTDAHNQNVQSELATKYLSEIEGKYGLEKGTLSGIYKRVLDEKDAWQFESKVTPKSYNYQIADDTKNARDFLREQVLNFPLESLEFSPELLGVLSTPYITPRPSANCDPGASKKEIFEDAANNPNTKMTDTVKEIYTEALPSLINQTLFSIQQEQTDLKGDLGKNRKNLIVLNGNNVDHYTPFGKYFLEMAIDDMMQFFITESLFDEDTYPVYRNGKLDYAYYDEKNGTKGSGKHLTLKKLGIPITNEKDVSEAVAKKLLKGLRKLQDTKSVEYQKFKDYLTEKYYKLDPEDYKIAEAVIDQTGAGLNWRFDAAKDVGDWDEAKEKQITAEQVWDDVIDIWKPFMREVRKYNPSSYVVAEVTSLHDFNNYDWGHYDCADRAESIFYEETGATTGSNYSTYFGLYPKLFGQNIENGELKKGTYRSINNFLLETQAFINPAGKKGNITSEFIEGSHIFLDNHDKPRAAHLMAVDAKLFWSDFNKGTNEEFMQRAQKVLQREYSDDMSSKAVAVAEKYDEYFEKYLKEFGYDDESVAIMKKAIAHVANGRKYKSTNENSKPNYKKADAFGAMPYEYTIADVIDQAEVMGLNFKEKDKKALYDKVRASMVAPYISKMTAIYEIMNGTTGIPTLFAGAEFAQTGCETKSKNWLLGCRNAIRHDWIKGNKKDDVAAFNARIKQIGMLHKKPGFAPLSGGTPIVVPVDVIGIASKDDLIAGLEKVGNNNKDDINKSCKFLECIKRGNATVQDAVNELRTMSEEEIKTKLADTLSKEDPGLVAWVKKNIQPSGDETGAIVKYNDKGDMTITMITNAYMPKDGYGAITLKEKGKVSAPKISSVTLKDSNGNLIAKPGSVFLRKTFNERYNEYVDNGTFVLTKEGKLISDKGEEATLDSTATYFCLQKPLYSSYIKPIN